MTDDFFMQKALDQAKIAFSLNEVPVGAVIVKNNEIIASGYNTREQEKSATSHAEIIAINAACKALGAWRLDGCEIFVTLEPCPMCAGAIINSRLRRVVFGAKDKAMGCVGGVANLLAMPFEHTVLYKSGVLLDECSQILNDFFIQIRDKSPKNS